MRTEIPVCKRCCFCLPLRYGLIVWGYFRLCITILMLFNLGLIWYNILVLDMYDISDRVYTGIAIILLIADFALSLVFIVGCHKKSVKLLKMFYFYSQCLLALSTVWTIYMLALLIKVLINHTFYISYADENYNYLLDFWIHALIETMIFFGYLLLQVYILLLVRSEIVKLNNGGQFRFINQADEAQCTLDVKTLPPQRLHDEDNDTEACRQNEEIIE